MEKVLLAIDGGGTKTKAVVFSKKGDILFTFITKVGSFAVSMKEAYQNIDESIEKMLDFCQDKYEILLIQMGISGLGAIFDVKILEKRYFDKYHLPVSIENDVFLALYSVIKDKYPNGAVIVSGTGSGLGGINNGEKTLIGGWGHFLDEYGSAYSFVKNAIMIVKEEYEKNNIITSFGKQLLKLMNLNEVNQFKAFMYTKSKSEIASYSKAIFILFKDKYQEVDKLIEKSVFDLKEGLKRLKNRLNLPDNAILGFRGAFICDAPCIQERLKRILIAENIFTTFEEEKIDSIYGAYYMRKGEFERC